MKHNILSNSRFGFKKAYSTDMAMSVLIDTISKAIDNKKHVIGLFFWNFPKHLTTIIIISY